MGLNFSKASVQSQAAAVEKPKFSHMTLLQIESR